MTLSKDDESRQDLDGVKEASRRVHEALEEIEKNGIPSNRIVLGGFSQGGALAMYSALTYHKQLAGILGLSSYIPIRRELVKECTEVNKQIPMLQCHGDCDPMVSIEVGRLTSQFLSDLNPSQYEFKVYRGLDHSMSQQVHSCNYRRNISCDM
jgi:predicted esterase